MQSQWPLTNTKYGTNVLNTSDELNYIVGTDMTYGDCVAGLIVLWFAFRTLTVVSLTLQDKAYQCQDPHDMRNTELKDAVQRDKAYAINE